MATIFDQNDLLPHGHVQGDEVRLSSSFTLSHVAAPSEQILLFRAETRTEGASAKIFFRWMLPNREKPL